MPIYMYIYVTFPVAFSWLSGNPSPLSFDKKIYLALNFKLTSSFAAGHVLKNLRIYKATPKRQSFLRLSDNPIPGLA